MALRSFWTTKRILILSAAALVLAGLAAFFLVVPKVVDGKYNAVFHAAPYAASEKAKELHKRLTVVDLHADSLLWDRDLLARNSRGHVDVPRLVEGNVAVQAFTIVTKVPRGLNIESNSDESDLITWLAVAERWPVATWSSLKERALYQARRLNALAAGSNGKLVLIKTAADLSSYLERRAADPNVTAGFIGIEGAHALEGDLNNIQVFFDEGVRMMSPSHFFDNDIGGSAHGLRKGGLTEKGKEMVRRMQATHMLVDLAHASPAVIADVLAVSSRPLVVSHTGVKGTCDNTRNLSDEQLKAIAGTGGLIGIGYWETAVCGRDAKAIARAIRYTADLVGVEHVGLGSDFDGAVTTPFDTTGLAQITDALIEAGFSEEEIRMIMGGNAIRLLMQSLP
ncbi:MAG TPA: dipeptidase [Pyrinomonadaceae bacterium]|jgi:microsomal dipeptidase-like Zn-dependent dipeptidase